LWFPGVGSLLSSLSPHAGNLSTSEPCNARRRVRRSPSCSADECHSRGMTMKVWASRWFVQEGGRNLKKETTKGFHKEVEECVVIVARLRCRVAFIRFPFCSRTFGIGTVLRTTPSPPFSSSWFTRLMTPWHGKNRKEFWLEAVVKETNKLSRVSRSS